ncbi:MAG: trypco2 family protein [Cyanobacteria bacterium P01_H01_bin.15]
MGNEIGLGELITKIKKELQSTDKASRAFLVEKVELELQVLVSKDVDAELQGQAKSDIKISVLSFDLFKVGEIQGSARVSGEMGRQDIQNIKLTLTPAVLNKDLMDSLEDATLEEVKKGTEKTVLQGDGDRI